MGKMTADELRRAGEAYRSENNGAQKSPVTVSPNTYGSSKKMTASELRQAGEAYRKENGLSYPIYRESPATAVDKYSTPSTQPTQASTSTQPTQAAPAGASSRKQSDAMKEQLDAIKKQRDDAAIKAGAYMRAGNMQQQAKEQQKIANKAAIEYENAYTQWKNQRNAEAVEDYNPDENKFKAGDAALSGLQNAFQSMGQYAAAASSYLSGNPEAQAWEAKRLMDSGVSGTEAVKLSGIADKREIPITDYKTQAELRHEKNVASVGAVEGGALQLVNTISNMVPSLVANAVLPGSGLPMMAASAAGNKYADAYEKYGNTDKAFVLGSAAGGASMLTEQFGGLYGSLGKSAAGQAVAKKLMAEAPGLYNLANSVGGKWLRDALSEGIEEGAEDVINYAIEKALTGDSDEMDNFGYDILLGALAGGVFGGGNAAMRSATYSRVGKALNASPASVAQQVQEGLEKGAGTAPAIYAAEVQKNPSNQMVGRLYEANLTYDAESGLSKIQKDITQVSVKEIKAMVSKADALAQAAQKLNVEATPQAVATAITEAQRTESIKTAEDSVGQAFAPTVDNPVNEGEKAYNSALAGVEANQGVAARINNDPAARQSFSRLTGVQFTGNTAQDIAAIEVATRNIAKSGKQAVSQAEYAQRVAAAGEQAAAQFDADMQAQAEQMQRESEERWLSVEQNTITDVDGKRRIKEITNTDVRGNTEIGYKKAEITKPKKKAVDAVNNAAKYLGKNIVWYEGALQVNGQYRLANGFRAPDGTIYVNINSRDPLMVTFGHEMFHDLVADGKYSGLIDTLVENPDYADMVNGMMNAKTELYERNGIELDPNAAAEEVAADISGDLLDRRDMLEYIGARNTEAATGIKGFLNRILKKLKGKPSAQEAYNRLSEAQRALIDGMEDGARNIFVDPAIGEDVKYSIREEAPPKKTILGYKVFVVKDGKLYPPMVANPNAEDTPVGVWLNADIGERAPDSKTGRMQVKAGGKGTQGGSGSLAFRPGWHLGEVPVASQFDRLNPETGKKELFPSNFVWAECLVAADIDYQEEAMSYGYTKSGKFQHSLAGLPKLPVDGYYKYRTNPRPDTVPWLITGAMKVNRILSDSDVAQILESKGITPPKRQGGEKTLEQLGLGRYANQQTASEADTMPETESEGSYSLMDTDSTGRELSAEQREYFFGSKVVDAEGRLKPVYHGSPAVFTEFSPDFMSQHGSSEGQGFYFTDYKPMAESYQKDGGQLLEGYLDIKKPLSDSEITLTRAEVKKLLQAVDPTGDEVISNYDPSGGIGYPSKAWYNRALDATVKAAMEYSDSDSEILAEIANSGAGTGAVLEAARNTLGYDGYIVEGKYDNATVYVAFDSSQFKNIDNTAPTESKDIRYSLMDIPAMDSEYYAAVESGNMQEAHRLVDEAAKAAGYNSEPLYHGTKSFGFTKIDTAQADDNISFFATSNPDMAQTYSGKKGNKAIKNAAGNISAMPIEDVVNRLNEEASNDGYEVGSSYRIMKRGDVKSFLADLDRRIESLNDVIARKVDEYADRLAEDFSQNNITAHDTLVRLLEATENYRYSGMSTPLWMLSKHTDVFNESEKELVGEIEADVRLRNRLEARGGSDDVVVREDLDRYSISVMSFAEAREELAKLSASGNYSLRGRTDNFLDVDGNNHNWNEIFTTLEPKGGNNFLAEYNQDTGSVIMSDKDGRFAEVHASTLSDALPGMARAITKKFGSYFAPQILSSAKDQLRNGATAEVAVKSTGKMSTRDIAKFAKEQGYRGVKISNIYDNGGGGKDAGAGDVYIFFYPEEDVKSADPVTYDDAGNVIPLSERFNNSNKDIRYSLMEDAQYMADIDKAVAEATQKANDELKAAQAQVKDLRKQLLKMRNRAEYAELQTKVTKKPTIDPIKAKKDIGRFLRKNGITNDETIKNLTAEIEDAFNSVYRGEKTDIDSVAKKVADTILKEATIADPLKAEKADIRKSLSQRTFVIGEQLRGDIVHKYGSLTNFRKKYGNIIRIKTRENAKASEGVAFDVAYSELQSEFPGIFRDALTEWETFENTVKAADYAMRSDPVMLADMVDSQEFADSVSNQLTEMFWNQKNLVTEADKAKSRADAATEKAVSAAVEAERRRAEKETAANDRLREAETKLLADMAAAKEREKAAKARAEFMAKYDALAKQYRADLRANNQQAQEKYNEKLTEAKDEFNRRRTQDRIDRVVREDQAKSKARLRAAEQKSTTTDDVAKVLTEMPKKDKETFKAKIAESWRTFKRQWINTKDELERFGNEVGDNRIMYAANNVGQAAAAAQYSIGGAGQYDLNGKKIGDKNLMQVFEPAKNAGLTDEFYTYLLHEHNVDRMSVREKAQRQLAELREKLNREVKGFAEMTDENIATAAGKDTTLTKAYTDEQIAAAKQYKQFQAWEEKQFDKPVFGSSVTASDSRAAADKLLKEHPEFEKWAKDVYAYLDGLMEVRKQGGLVSEDMVQRMKELYPHYVPTYRDMPSTSGGYSNPNSVAVNSTIKAAKGGNQDIMPLIDSIARQTLQTFSAAKKNILGNMLYEDAMDTTRDISEYIQSVTEEGDLVDLDADSAETLKNTLRIWVDGKPVTLHMSEAMADGFRPIEQSNSFGMKALRSINSTFKKLVTQWHPVFIVRNFVRDAQSALYFTHYSNATFIKNYGKAVKEIATNGKYWQLYQAMGGKGTTYYDPKTGLSDRHHFKNGAVDKVAGGLNRVIDILSFANEAVEQYPRLAEFISTMEDTGDVQQALYNAADITTNFGRGGFAARKLNASLVPFFNPGMQGLSKNIRNVIDRRGWKEIGQLISRLLINGVAPGIIRGLLYDGLKEDDDYKELSNYIKDSNILIKIGDNKFIKVPMGREPSVITAFTNRMWRWLKGEPASSAFADYPSFAIEQLAPNNPLTNNIFAGITAMSTNKNWYGGDIVSSYMEEKPDYLQYDESTDAFSIWLGEITRHGKNGIEGLSPKKVNYLIDQYSGFIGDWVLPAISKKADVPAVVKAFVVDSVRQNRLGSDFYDALADAKAVNYMEEATAADKATYSYLLAQSKAASDITKQLQALYDSGEKTRNEKREEARDLLELRNEIYRNALLTVGTYEETAKSIDSSDSDVVKREANRKVFGAEYALKTYNKDVGEKAAEYVAQGVTYDQYYASYFATRGITGDKDENGKTITNSASRKKKEAIDKAVPNATTKQKHLLYEASGVSEKVW